MSASIFTNEVRASIDKCILCWLATVSADAWPNVSPKEIFCAYKEDYILIANIASPQSVRNIKSNSKVCLSFVDILVQKGYQIKGEGRIVTEDDPMFGTMKVPLYEMAGDRFPFRSITSIKALKAKPILAPSYMLYPNLTSEKEQIAIARKAYNL